MNNKLKACIVDDDEIIRITVQRLFDITGRIDASQSFPDGEEAIDFFKKNYKHQKLLPDIIFLDLQMPHLDGIGFLKEFEAIVASMKKYIPIVVVSSSKNDIDIKRAQKYNCVREYVVKPLSLEKLNSLISNHDSIGSFYSKAV